MLSLGRLARVRPHPQTILYSTTEMASAGDEHCRIGSQAGHHVHKKMTPWQASAGKEPFAYCSLENKVDIKKLVRVHEGAAFSPSPQRSCDCSNIDSDLERKLLHYRISWRLSAYFLPRTCMVLCRGRAGRTFRSRVLNPHGNKSSRPR